MAADVPRVPHPAPPRPARRRPAPDPPAGVSCLPQRTLPPWTGVLAVVAHPDDESFGLGAVLNAFIRAGATAAVLCFTHGEASTLHGVAGDLRRIRASELAVAGGVLGVGTTILYGYRDGRLAETRRSRLAARVLTAIQDLNPDGLLVFDPSGVTGHRDHVAATAAGLAAARTAGLPVLGWTLPNAVAHTLNAEQGTAFTGHPLGRIDLVVTVERASQRVAARAHASQALPTSVLWRRLELLGDREYLRCLTPARG